MSLRFVIRKTGIFVWAGFCALLLVSCAPHNPAEQRPDGSFPGPFGQVRQLHAEGQQAIRDEDWIRAQQLLDMAVAELLEVPSPARGEKAFRTERAGIMRQILASLEQLYPQLANMGEIDTLFRFIEPDEFYQDSSRSQVLHSFLDTLDLSTFSIPVVLNERVLAEIDYLSTGRARKFTENTLRRMGRFEADVRRRLREKNMPEDLVYLAFVESGYKLKAYSHAGASGLWQFISSTGKRYGMQVDWWVDMRRNPEQATDAALAYLKDLYDEFQDWWLAMAAYNAGEGRVRRMIRKYETRNYWDLPLPKETLHYVPRIIAAMIISHNQREYGIEVEPAPAWSFDTMTVNYCIPLEKTARATGVKIDSLRGLNPELKRWCTPPGMKAFLLRLPPGTRQQFAEAYEKMDKKSLTGWHRHKVKWGDNLGSIAATYGVPVAAIKSANNLKSSRIKARQILLIPLPAGAVPPPQKIRKKVLRSRQVEKRKSPVGKSKLYTVQKGDNLYEISRRFGVGLDDLRAWNNLDERALLDIGQKLKLYAIKGKQKKKTSESIATKNYSLKPGDTYYGLARKFSTSVAELQALNGTRSRRLVVGQVIQIPDRPEKSVEKTAGKKSKKRVGNQKPGPEAIWYVLRRGDTLWDLSKRFGIDMKTLKEWNRLDETKLRPGRRLKVGEY